jgi:hypothetical protein
MKVNSFYDILTLGDPYYGVVRYPDPIGSVVTQESPSWREKATSWLESKGYVLESPTEGQLNRLSAVFNLKEAKQSSRVVVKGNVIKAIDRGRLEEHLGRGWQEVVGW